MDRREFLKVNASALAVAAGVVSASPAYAIYNESSRPGLGLQLYTIRDLMSVDVRSALALVAEVGYRHVEFAGYFEYPAIELRRMLDDTGLTAPSAHVGQSELTANLDAVIESASILGQRYVTVPALYRDERASLSDYYRAAERFNVWGEACRRAGIRFAYHNHAFEFVNSDGQVLYDVLLDETDPALVAFELDLYWIRKAGRSELEYFERYPGRFPLWHMKDMDAEGEIIEVGDGIIDFARIFDNAADSGVRYGFVEHDNPEDSVWTIRRSHAAMAPSWADRYSQ